MATEEKAVVPKAVERGKRDYRILSGARRLVQMGGSVGISLPKKWLDRHGLKPGDDVGVVADAILKIVPVQEID